MVLAMLEPMGSELANAFGVFINFKPEALLKLSDFSNLVDQTIDSGVNVQHGIHASRIGYDCFH